MGKLSYILFGIIFLVAAVWLAYTYPQYTVKPALYLLAGALFIFLLIFGFSFFLIALAVWKIEKEKKRFTGFFSSVGFPRSPPFQPPSSPEEELPPTISSEEYKEFVKEEKKEQKEQPKKSRKK